jgi:Domain of unknown function (DUF5047)
MITTLSTEATNALTRSFTYYARYSSWLGDTLLATDIPVDSGNESGDRASAVAERVELTVPLRYRGTSWAPTGDTHPLAANGQRIRVELGIGLRSGMIEWFQRGEFVIVNVDTDDESVSLECAGLMYWVEEAELISPYQPSGDLATTIRALVEPAVNVVFDPALVNRSVPTGMNFDQSRIGGLNELVDAWPADYVMSSEGYLYVYSATAPRAPVTTITDAAGGRIIEVTGKSTREGAYNAVVARGQTSAGAQFQAVAYDTSGGPKAYGGPFNALPVPYFFQSPLLTSVSQAQTSAETILRRLRRETGRQFQVETVPDPRLQVGDLVTLACAEYTGPAEIDTLRLPYGPDSPMAMDLRTVVS